MTLTESRNEGSARFAEAAVPPQPLVVRRRRSRGAAAVAVALVGTGVAVGVAAVHQAGSGVEVLALAHDVPAGSQLTDADLIVVKEPNGSALATMPSAERTTVIGRYAAVALLARTTLTDKELTSTPVPGPGFQLVAVLVKPGQAPARGLAPGDPLSIVGTPGDGGDAPSLGAPVSATVKDIVPSGTADGSEVVDVVVADADAPDVAKAASTGHVALIALPAKS